MKVSGSRRSRTVMVGVMLAAAVAVVPLAAHANGTAHADTTTEQPHADDGSTEPHKIIEPFDQARHDKLAASLAEHLGVSVQRAELRMSDGNAVIDFREANIEDPAFGMSYVDPTDLLVHIRLVDESFEPKVAELERQLGHPVVRSYGGAPAKLILGFPQLLHDSGYESQVGFRQDDFGGYIEVWNGLDLISRLIDPQWIHVVDAPTEPVETRSSVSQSGADVDFLVGGSYGGIVCTTAFIYKIGHPYPDYGFGTAGHCPTVSNTLSAGYGYSSAASPLIINCGSGGDYANWGLQNGTSTRDTNWWYQAGPYDIGMALIWTSSIAAGDAVYREGITTSSWGTVRGFNSGTLSSSQCSPRSGGTTTYLETNFGVGGPAGQQGDSGGPVLYLYQNYWYLMSQTSHTTYDYLGININRSQWIPWESFSAGTYWTQICNANLAC